MRHEYQVQTKPQTISANEKSAPEGALRIVARRQARGALSRPCKPPQVLLGRGNVGGAVRASRQGGRGPQRSPQANAALLSADQAQHARSAPAPPEVEVVVRHWRAHQNTRLKSQGTSSSPGIMWLDGCGSLV